MDAEIILHADYLRQAGISIIVTDKDKIPVAEWKNFQTVIPTKEELQQMVNSPYAANVATIGGKVSGGLEIIDFEGEKKAGKCVFLRWSEIVITHNPDLAQKLVLSGTPSGGVHVRYKCKECGKNTKLAVGENGKVLIETRGEGGYALCPPSDGYQKMQGEITDLPLISPDERKFLLSVARSFNEVIKQKYEVKEKAKLDNSIPMLQSGDDFNKRGDHAAILQKHGWELIFTNQKNVEYWRRPGKDKSWSATWNHIPDRFYVFSSNAEPFEEGKLYDNFALFSFLECDGDFKKSARALGEQGYGEQKASKQASKQVSEQVKNLPEKSTQLPNSNNFDIVNFKCTDSGNAELFAELHGANLRFDHSREKWLQWNGGYWELDGMQKVTQLTKEAMRFRLKTCANIEDDDSRAKQAKWALSSESSSKITACLGIAKSEPNIAVDNTVWDQNQMLLQVKNGTIDLQTGQLQQSKRENFISLSADVSYDEKAECPRWQRFLAEVFDNNQALVEYIQRAVGYSLTGNINEHCFFLCYGTGRNGKGTLLNIIGSLLKDYATSTAFSTFELNKYQQNTNDLAALRGVRFVSAQETQEARKLNEARVKSVTGGDPITCRYLYSEFFTYVPNFKVWLSVNHKPTIRDTSIGMWSRVRLIPFNVNFWGREDKQLAQTLEEEKAGILNWSIEGCLKWQKSGLSEPEIVLSETQEYRKESDPIGQFLDEKAIIDTDAETKASDLYAIYEEWAKANGEYCYTSTTFGRKMIEKGFEKEKRGYVYYRGVGILLD